jgi:hypothetical protein
MLCFENLVSFSLNKKRLRQALLPTSKGGIGLRSAVEHSSACYIASISSAYHHSSLSLAADDKSFEILNSLIGDELILLLLGMKIFHRRRFPRR